MVEGIALWFGGAGFEVLDVAEVGVELVIEVETARRVVACSTCGTRAVPKNRGWVTLRDTPAGSRPVLVRWRKRLFNDLEEMRQLSRPSWRPR